MKGKVVKKIADKFVVNGALCVARGQLKQDGIFVGDKVEFDPKNSIIEKVYPRTNLLLRPPIANVNQMIIVIAPLPKPDFLLVDKLIVFCLKNGVEPILCVNKSDILPEQLKLSIEKIYSKILKICFVSAKNNDCSALLKLLKGLSAFAGQSAVGKSSIINILLGEEKEKVGSLSKRVDRGKQTTRVCTIYEIKKGCMIADSAGFSKLDEGLIDVEARDLANYFVEFRPHLNRCKFASCAHIKERECEVKKAVKNGEISHERYENYKKIYEVIKSRRSYEKKG